MFCQKCGTKNPDNGKFCRSCGTDLSPASNALSENFNKTNWMKMIPPVDPMQLRDRKGKPVHWEGAITKLFTGIAFLVVTIVLSYSVMGTGWWFWMLIPAFSCLGAGVAQIIQLQKNEKRMISAAPPETRNSLREDAQARLSSSQTDYIAPDSRYKTGDLVPPSVVESTTRHLEINTEGETMTLPKKD